MLEHKKKHKRGKKTLIYLFIIYGWWLTLVGLGFIYLAWAINFGSIRPSVQNFLAVHSSWYIDISMLTLWFSLIGVSIIFIAYLRASVLYRYYKFILDEYAFHLYRGWFSIRERTIPYRQISNVHITRPYHYRLFGIVKLDIVTAADRDIGKENPKKEFLIPIIDKKVARILARQLLESSSRSRDRREDYEEDDEIDGDNDDVDDEVLIIGDGDESLEYTNEDIKKDL